MSDLWFLAREKQKHGPYTFDQMADLYDAGKLLPNDMIMKKGTDKWIEAREIFFRPLIPVPEKIKKLWKDWKDSKNRTLFGGAAIGTLSFLLFFCLLPFNWMSRSKDFDVALSNDKPSIADQSEIKQKPRKDNAGFAQNEDKAIPSLTEDFLPHKPGSIAVYLIDMPNGVGTAKHRYSFQEEGKINRTLVSIGDRFMNIHSFGDKRIISDGFVGVTDKNGLWLDCLKIGAKPGDRWEKSGSRYALKSFGNSSMKYDRKPRQTVSILAEIGGVKTTSVYVKGIGLLERNGDSPAGKVHWRLDQLEKEMNLTKAERAFYE